jgi:hypothetical protein
LTVKPLDDHDEVLFRHIHPKLYENGISASVLFAPSPKDRNQLSVDRGALTTPAASRALYTGNGFESAAVYGVSVGEFVDEELQCYPDPLPKTDKLAANPAHAYADFSAFSPNEGKKIAKRLRNNAVKRGCLTPPA